MSGFGFIIASDASVGNTELYFFKRKKKKKKWSNLKREHHLLIELHTTYKPSFHPFLAQISTELSDNRQKKMHIDVEEERATKWHKRISQTEKGEKRCRKCDRNMVLIFNEWHFRHMLREHHDLYVRSVSVALFHFGQTLETYNILAHVHKNGHKYPSLGHN